MASPTQKILLGVVAGVLVVLLVWAVLRRPGGSTDEAQAPQKTLVACSNAKCGFSGELDLKKLVFDATAGKRPARIPMAGPGYKCPKCGQSTLYTDPMKCAACGTLYLPRQDAAGATVQTCPKCGKGP